MVLKVRIALRSYSQFREARVVLFPKNKKQEIVLVFPPFQAINSFLQISVLFILFQRNFQKTLRVIGK